METDTELQTLEQFIARHGIEFTAEPRATRDDGLMRDSKKHWLCRLRNGEALMVLWFSGRAAVHSVSCADVLNYLAMDTSGIEGSFEEWARDLGYDEDSRAAERIYNACVDQSAELHRLLGQELFDELLYKTERL